MFQIELAPQEVQERFDWAKRQGNPQWLWPDVTKDDWVAALASFERAMRDVMKQGGSGEVLSGDPEAVSVAGYTSGVGPLLGLWIEQGRLVASSDVAEVLRLHLKHNRARAELLGREAEKITDLLHTQNVRATLLKGAHTSQAYFAEPGIRPSSDIDIWIDPADESQTVEALSAAGYEGRTKAGYPPQQSWRLPASPDVPRSLSLVHSSDPWSIDLHTSINRRYSAGAPVVCLDDAVANPQVFEWPRSPRAATLRQPLLLLHLAVHASAGFGSMTLIRLVEIALVARQDTHSGALSWDEFLDAAGRAGALGLIYPAIAMCNRLVPDTIPKTVEQQSLAEAPRSVLRVFDGMTPASIQGVTRCSLRERYMWTSGLRNTALHLFADITLPYRGSASLRSLYLRRLQRIGRGRLSWGVR